MKKESRYPWHEAPEWARYAATDEDGKRWWYEEEPYLEDFDWVESEGNVSEIENDWENSLEERPNEHN